MKEGSAVPTRKGISTKAADQVSGRLGQSEHLYIYFPQSLFHDVPGCSLPFPISSYRASFSRTCINNGIFLFHCLQMLCEDSLWLWVSYINWWLLRNAWITCLDQTCHVTCCCLSSSASQMAGTQTIAFSDIRVNGQSIHDKFEATLKECHISQLEGRWVGIWLPRISLTDYLISRYWLRIRITDEIFLELDIQKSLAELKVSCIVMCQSLATTKQGFSAQQMGRGHRNWAYRELHI